MSWPNPIARGSPRSSGPSSSRTIGLPPSRCCDASQTPSTPALVNDLRDGEESILAFYDLPSPHRRRVNSARCLAHARAEIQRHCRMIGIFPYRLSLLRLCGVILQEQNDEWIAGPRYVGRRRDGTATTVGQPWTGLETDSIGSRSTRRVVPAA